MSDQSRASTAQLPSSCPSPALVHGARGALANTGSDAAAIVRMEGRRQGPSWVITVCGELDLLGRDLAGEAFAEAATAACDQVVVDAGGLTFVDCAGLDALLTAAQRYTGPVWLRSPSPPLRLIAGIVGIGPSDWRGDGPAGDVRIA